MPGAVAFVLKGYPRLSETFIAQEILGLMRRGVDVRIISLRHPTEARRHPVHDEIATEVNYLPEYLRREPLRVLRAWWAGRRRAGWRAALVAWRRDFKRDRTRNRIRRFGQALVLARELPAEITHLHAHFLHTPASVVRYAALLTGLDWSASAHAKDIWTTPEWELGEKLAEAAWVAACTAHSRDHLAALCGGDARVELVYHGLDFARFPAPGGARPARDGADADDPVVLLSVGRAVEKKGYDVLLAALARLPERLAWRFVHIGGGERLGALRRQAAELGLESRIDWMGERAQAEVLALCREADLFVLPSRVAGDGDRDGLPNVLMEAQSQGLVCLSTRLSAIPELIEDEVTGVLVAPGDEAALAAALERLIAEPALRARLGRAGHSRVRANFSHEPGLDRLAALFGLAAAPPDALVSDPCTSPSTRR